MAKAVGVDKNADDMGMAVLLAQFGCTSTDVVADGSLQAVEAGNYVAKAAAANDVLATGFVDDEFATRNTLHFALGALEHDTELFS